MDSEHRHELKENDLQQFLGNFGQWWAKNGNTTLIAVTLVLLVVFGVRLYRSSVQATHDESWFDWANANSPASLKQVAAEYSDPTIQALAYLHAGDMLLNEALRAAPVGESAVAAVDDPDTDDAAAALDEAHTLYTTVATEAQHPVYRLNARLGLGAVAEARRDWSAAAEQYETIQQQAGDAYATIAQRAADRLALLPDLEQPVIFAPETVYAPTDPGYDPTGAVQLPGFETPDFAMPDATAQTDAPSDATQSPAEDAPAGDPAADTP